MEVEGLQGCVGNARSADGVCPARINNSSGALAFSQDPVRPLQSLIDMTVSRAVTNFRAIWINRPPSWRAGPNRSAYTETNRPGRAVTTL